MYPLLRFEDPSWPESIAREIESFAQHHRHRLEECRREGGFPRALYREMGERGWIGSVTPEAYGGAGGGAPEYCVIAEEIARRGVITPQISVQGQMFLLGCGTTEQQARYLPGLASGNIIFSEAISEPEAGSSFANLRSSAIVQGDGWVLNGKKCHVNLGAESDLTLFLANSEAGLTTFLVDTDLPGVNATPTDAIGMRMTPTAEMTFEEVSVAKDAVLGEPGGGLEAFLDVFNLSRLGNASELIGHGRRAQAAAVDYAAQRKVGDSHVTDFQGIRWTVAEAYIQLRSAALARDEAVILAADGEEHGLETSVAKLLAIRAAEFATNEAYALVGGHGMYHDTVFPSLLHEVKLLRVAGGSQEVLRNYVSKRVLKANMFDD